MKTAICYYSVHHGNTKKLLDAIYKKHPDIDLIDITNEVSVDLAGYDRIGIASGIYFSDFAKQVYTFIGKNFPAGKQVFLIYTAGLGKSDKFEKRIQNAVRDIGCTVTGIYGCAGYDTYGPLKLIGGIKKGHPDQTELAGAAGFYESL